MKALPGGRTALVAVLACLAVLTTGASPSPTDTTSSSSPSPSTSGATSGATSSAAAVTLAPTHGPRFGTVQVTLSGFPVCESGLSTRPNPVDALVTWDDTPATRLTTVRTGTKPPSSGTFTVPEGAGDGVHTVTATCPGFPPTVATAHFTVAPPTLTADPARSAPGSTTTLVGTGFACPADDTVALVWGTTALPGPGKPDADGGFRTGVTVPADAAAGDHDVRASCAAEPRITADVHVLVPAPGPTTSSPTTPTPPQPSPVRTMTASPGAPLHVSGRTNACTGGADPRQVVLSWDGGPRSHPVTADESGRFRSIATVPATAPTGPHRITVECAGTHTVTEIVPVVVAQHVPPPPPKPHLLWIVLGALAGVALAAFGLRRVLRPGGTAGRAGRAGRAGTVTAEAGAWGDARTELTERPGPAGPGHSVRLVPRPDPGRQSFEEVRDDDGRDG
ncbi:hypothetical protein ACFXPX_23895 [Kitasatospora sp. NPDC059146]|uniref:hypothetical protein n=1 Tax=Kitasatospora sp. NPDC059146 TaxID=3346741 RepID=UPI0036C4333A